MTVRHVSFCNGDQESTISDVTPENPSDVIFMAKSENEVQCASIAFAIKDVYDRWVIGVLRSYENIVRAHNNWDAEHEGLQEPVARSYYVYAYSSPAQDNVEINGPMPSDIFYVGKGTRARWIDHLKEALEFDPANNHLPNEYQKIRLIRDYIDINNATGNTGQRERTGRDLVRLIAQFKGDHSEAKSYAAEYFLINHWRSIFLLANSRSGDTKFNRRDHPEAYWLARPYGITSEYETWKKVVGNFVNRDGVTALTQVLQRGLICAQFNHEEIWDIISAKIQALREITPDARIVTDGTDVSIYCIVLANHNNQAIPFMRMQFRLSGQGLMARINLRPLQGENRDVFCAKIASMFFGELSIINPLNPAHLYIRNFANAPFFKPCAANGNGDKDVNFLLTDLDQSKYTLTHTKLYEEESKLVTFKNVLDEINRRANFAQVCCAD